VHLFVLGLSLGFAIGASIFWDSSSVSSLVLTRCPVSVTIVIATKKISIASTRKRILMSDFRLAVHTLALATDFEKSRKLVALP
jgi:hypothetical protein